MKWAWQLDSPGDPEIYSWRTLLCLRASVCLRDARDITTCLDFIRCAQGVEGTMTVAQDSQDAAADVWAICTSATEQAEEPSERLHDSWL